MKLLVLVDTIQYVNNEIYQQHLHPLLRQAHDCTYLELNDFSRTRNYATQFEHVFSAMRLRNLYKNVELVRHVIGHMPITVQDYDPWVSYKDGSPYKGAYEIIADNLNVKNFMVSSVEWAKFIQHPAFGVQLGVSPYMCKFTPWENRALDVEFRGSHYIERQRNFETLARFGICDVWKKEFISPYAEFLKYLDNLKIWLQFENEPLIVDGQQIEANWLWPKAIEILSRGCFLVRNRQTEASHYGIDELPTACLVDTVEEIPAKIEWVKNLDSKTKNKMIETTVSILKRRRFYETIVEEFTRSLQ